ncbi:Alpha/beta hydrolase fold-3 [Niveomyces insectorum RCEF 264]|uniref:Alpha/beta hydrolase fold-3 n=1 Tax=Niveomyces insectorum RCEF 264 TaxID=1081102 RepID=A0A167Z042_9HYPO|nr:Alpha/beta hydrolase fold-3 [Niveomyces insectorum RCEF 264]
MEDQRLSSESALSPIDRAARGNEIVGLDLFKKVPEDMPMDRITQLMNDMHADLAAGGTDMAYGTRDTQHLRFWAAGAAGADTRVTGAKTDGKQAAPLVLFVHGGSWSSGTHLDSLGSAKVAHLTRRGYAFASVNFTLVPAVTVAAQAQEVADALGYLASRAADLGIDPTRLVLMGHSSGAHVAALLGTDTTYLTRAGVAIDCVRGVVALDGSNYNVMADLLDSPGPVADNALWGLGRDPAQLVAMSPTHHARAPNARAFLLLHVERSGGIRQAVELVAALQAADTEAELHVFEGEFFEGHVQMLLRVGRPDYPATAVLDLWLEKHVPVGGTESSQE